MPRYSYRGRNGGGELVLGVAEAASSTALADQLFGTGVTPLEIAEASASKDLGSALGKLGGDRVGDIEIMLFSRQMYTLLKAGVPIMRALKGLQDSTTHRGFGEVVGEIRGDLDSGRELSACLARHAQAFSPFYLAMVRVGEMTGRLDEVFLRLFNHLEFERVIRDQVKSALRYPGFVVATMLAAIVVVNIWVIPAFAKVYQGFNTELPRMTQVLIGFSDFMVEQWPLLLGLLAGTVVGCRWWISRPQGRETWHRIKLRLPIVGKIIHKGVLARFARSFALASRSGVPLVQALSVVSQTVDNDYIAGKIARMREGIERGESVLRTAIGSGVFTPVVLQMVSVGEESGALDDMMEEIADMYQRDVEYDIKNLSAQIEPILIVCLGVLVLVLALGIFLPIWDLGQAALGKGR
ncbi:MAG: type II secretion system F family protein [Rhodocyclaceae bacterium]